MPKKNNPTRILAIDPGTRETGVAILENESLCFYGVKTLKKKRPKTVLLKEARKIIYRLIEDYDPQVFVIEKTFFSKNLYTSHLQDLSKEMIAAAKRKGLKTHSYAPKTVRKFVCKDGKATKKDVAQILSARYPELTIYLSQDRKWKEKYWLNMFDALALGLTCLYNL